MKLNYSPNALKLQEIKGETPDDYLAYSDQKGKIHIVSANIQQEKGRKTLASVTFQMLNSNLSLSKIVDLVSVSLNEGMIPVHILPMSEVN